MWMSMVVVLAAGAAPPPATPTPAPAARLANRTSSSVQPSAGSLADLASRVKLRLPQGQQERVLTNESLKVLGAGVELTTASSAPPLEGDGGRQADADEAQRQERWQERYQEARAEADFLEQEVRRLEGEVGRLETEFYSTDDPVRRDTVVKPAWDQALTDLQVTRERLAAARSAPDEVRDEALRDGALPGWFRGLPTPAAEPGGADKANTGGG